MCDGALGPLSGEDFENNVGILQGKKLIFQETFTVKSSELHYLRLNS